MPIIRELCAVINVIPFKKDILFFPLEQYTGTEDALLYFIAVNGKMNYFITRNVRDVVFTFPSLPVITPAKFLKEIFNDLQK